MAAQNPQQWIKKVTELTNQLNHIVNEYDSILDSWVDMRAEAWGEGKHEVDECFTNLTDARSRLCGLRGGKGGGRSQRKQRRTRKH